MGFFEDLGKELDDFIKWAEDFEYEPVYYEEPVYEEVTDTFYAPIGDFFEFLEPDELLKKYKTPASPPDIVKDFVKAIRGEEEEEEEEELWYEYYVSREDGYFGATFLSHQAEVYYSTNPNAHQVAYDRFLDMYGSGWYGGPPPYGHEVLPDVDGPTEVDKDDVDDERVIQ